MTFYESLGYLYDILEEFIESLKMTSIEDMDDGDE
jgi:hypothetical protein